MTKEEGGEEPRRRDETLSETRRAIGHGSEKEIIEHLHKGTGRKYQIDR